METTLHLKCRAWIIFVQPNHEQLGVCIMKSKEDETQQAAYEDRMISELPGLDSWANMVHKPQNAMIVISYSEHKLKPQCKGSWRDRIGLLALFTQLIWLFPRVVHERVPGVTLEHRAKCKPWTSVSTAQESQEKLIQQDIHEISGRGLTQMLVKIWINCKSQLLAG